jgi:hypothetical protein
MMKDIPDKTIESANDMIADVIKNESQYDENGIDITLVRWMLSLTPTQRLEVLQSHINSIARLLNESRQS